MTRPGAYSLLSKYLKNKNLIKHSLACEAAMKGVYDYLTPNIKQTDAERLEWGITGLLHDIDYEIAQKENRLDQHGLLIFSLEPEVIPDKIAHAIKAHNFENTRILPESNMDWAIACVDSLTGLIVACALIHPDRRLEKIDTQFVIKRFEEKSFAKGASRNSIKQCEEKLNIKLEDFISITLSAMQKIHSDLEL